jgi:hypothetical protein
MARYQHLLAPHAQYLDGNHPDALQDWSILFQPHHRYSYVKIFAQLASLVP